MIHQFIFAGPKPGLSAEAFQCYWVHFHAVDYAARIPQIRQYLVAPRLRYPCKREVPFFEGVAEIWVANEEEQIASFRSPEFLQGARADEPRWAAFWQTFVHEAESVVIRESVSSTTEFTKFYSFLKRQPGTDLDEFRRLLLKAHGETVLALPGLQGYLIGFARRGLYGLGEPRFDAIEVWSFEDLEKMREALVPERLEAVEESWRSVADDRYLFTFVGRENWIIRPGERSGGA
ncbi:EthD domain-containing protein [Syntrophobacter fumaroxidans]|uniref:Ethyl tert-butyl ether degradation EthD n=1 Tax=Syntrophobacter fumaroxidans (strain DSM 10017 / MPOB) TaxID=335543 RepID=A0LJD3_SYNFM|nr:EthD domain-containing protein [Syntrophobacter fumaroxidans]ABK17535.1 Ethyl tert-butyl ether degradation EthD [Syntrophobacter fumaroxidans MPOB]